MYNIPKNPVTIIMIIGLENILFRESYLKKWGLPMLIGYRLMPILKFHKLLLILISCLNLNLINNILV